MSVVQNFSEQDSVDSIIEWAHANPTLPRLIGIDVGQQKLAVWFGAPRPGAKAETPGGARFVYFAWILISCSGTSTNAQACQLVLRGLNIYRKTIFALASDVVVEKQHKKNGRMRAISKAIVTWVKNEVPNGKYMRVIEREARHKFANVVGMPCPMPREYEARKQAALSCIRRQVARTGARWQTYLSNHADAGDDLSDAALIAQDYAIANYPLSLFATHSLESVSRVLAQRRSMNTWRANKKMGRFKTGQVHDNDSDGEIQIVKRRRDAAPPLVVDNWGMVDPSAGASLFSLIPSEP